MLFIFLKVDNIDVEGRFIFVDVFCYVSKFNFCVVIDVVIFIGNCFGYIKFVFVLF